MQKQDKTIRFSYHNPYTHTSSYLFFWLIIETVRYCTAEVGSGWFSFSGYPDFFLARRLTMIKLSGLLESSHSNHDMTKDLAKGFGEMVIFCIKGN